MNRTRFVGLAIAFGTSVAATGMAAPAWAQVAASEAMPLLLEVSLNGRTTGLIVPFVRRGDRLSAKAGELRALRLPVTAERDVEPISLENIAGLTYTYDEPRQTIALAIDPVRLETMRFDARDMPEQEGESTTVADTGRSAVLRYSLVGAGAGGNRGLSYSGLSAAFDARYYRGATEGRQTGLIVHDRRGLHGLRLDTTWTRIDPARGRALTIGDAISGATAWSRPVRFGGIQLSHDFRTRPDLVTVPLPGVTGTAAVPSSLDVYIDGFKRYSTEVPEGRFQIDDLPAVTGAGNARVVLRDVQGREVETATPFFVSGRLLRAGLSETTLEAGFARRSYGVRSSDYARMPIASGSGRVGLRSGLTLEGHFEAAPRLALAGGGASLPIGRYGVLSVAAAGSMARAGSGALFYAGAETGSGPFRLTFETRRTTRYFFDLAALTTRVSSRFGRFGSLTALLPPRASDRATVSVPTPVIGGLVSVSYARETRRGERTIQTASLYYSRTLSSAMSVSVSAFHSVGRRGNGLFAGLSLPFGGRSVATLGITRQDGGSGVTVEAQQSLDIAPGSLGWRVGAVAGDHPLASAAVDYRGSAATVRGQLAHRPGATYGSVAVEGAVVATGGAVFTRSRLDGAFAVVDAGTPGIPVLSQNRMVGHTDAHGLLLVGDLHPFERNKLAIDPDALPLDRAVDRPVAIVRPSGQGGVRVTFAARTTGRTLHLVDENGYDLPLGAEASINGSADDVIGYDGLVLAPLLRARNVVRVAFDERRCVVAFDAPPTSTDPIPSSRPIGPLVCRAPDRMAAADPMSDGRPR